MAPPSRKQQIDAVVKFLDSERNQERSLEVIAAEVVDGFHSMLLKGVKKPATPLREGMLLKSPYDAKVRRVAWLDDGRGEVWIVHEASSYGWLGPLLPATWEYCEEFRSSKMVETDELDAKGKPKKKRVEMTDDEIAEAWSNPDWSVGDRVSQHQREHSYEIIATAPQCVLMEHALTGVLSVDSNKSLSRYYRRERIEEQW